MDVVTFSSTRDPTGASAAACAANPRDSRLDNTLSAGGGENAIDDNASVPTETFESRSVPLKKWATGHPDHAKRLKVTPWNSAGASGGIGPSAAAAVIPGTGSTDPVPPLVPTIRGTPPFASGAHVMSKVPWISTVRAGRNTKLFRPLMVATLKPPRKDVLLPIISDESTHEAGRSATLPTNDEDQKKICAFVKVVIECVTMLYWL